MVYQTEIIIAKLRWYRLTQIFLSTEDPSEQVISAAHLKVTKSEKAVLEGISEIIQSFNWYSGFKEVNTK